MHQSVSAPHLLSGPRRTAAWRASLFRRVPSAGPWEHRREEADDRERRVEAARLRVWLPGGPDASALRPPVPGHRLLPLALLLDGRGEAEGHPRGGARSPEPAAAASVCGGRPLVGGRGWSRQGQDDRDDVHEGRPLGVLPGGDRDGLGPRVHCDRWLRGCHQRESPSPLPCSHAATRPVKAVRLLPLCRGP